MTLLSPPRLAATLLRWFGPRDESIEGDLLEGFQRRSGSRGWYWWQVAIALRVAAVREISERPITLSATVVFGMVVYWVLVDHVAFPIMLAVDHAYSMWRMGQGHDAQLFGQLFVETSFVLRSAGEALGAAVAVRVYRGHRPMLALIYAGAVFARCVGSLMFDSIYYDPTANALHYDGSFPPIGIGTLFYLFPLPSLAALIGGLWAGSRQEVVTRSLR